LTGNAEPVAAAVAIRHAPQRAVKKQSDLGLDVKTLGDLGDGYSRRLPPAGAVQSFVQNQEIYGEGDDAEIFYRVVSGVVRTCKFLSDGRRQIDAFHIAGDVFGFEAGHEHALSAEAVCDCAVIAYRWRDIDKLLADGEALPHPLFAYAMQSLARAQEHSILLGCRNATEKLAVFLTDWATHSRDGEVITLEMTRQDIADYLGLTVETISRVLSVLEQDALIDRPSVRGIRLKDPARLRALVC
jgi:CRP/FNR family nitrogen fixation transcriptional regulator